MRVLITGVTGFAGRHLAAHCLERGAEVHGAVREGRAGAAPAGVSAHEVALSDPERVRDLLDRVAPDRIFHLAGAASVGRSFDDALAAWDGNVGTTVGLLEALRASGAAVRTLVVTSGEVYGLVPVDRLPADADTPLRPASPYGASKAAADLAALQYRQSEGLPILRVRAFNHIGPGQDPRFVLPNVARQIARAEREGRSEVVVKVGNVDTRRDFTDVRDMVRAYRLLADAGDPDTLYLACSGRSLPVRDLVEGIAPLARLDARVESDPSLRRAGEQPDLYGDNSALARDTGWSPRVPLTTTLRDTLEHWRERVADEPPR